MPALAWVVRPAISMRCLSSLNLSRTLLSPPAGCSSSSGCCTSQHSTASKSKTCHNRIHTNHRRLYQSRLFQWTPLNSIMWRPTQGFAQAWQSILLLRHQYKLPPAIPSLLISMKVKHARDILLGRESARSVHFARC